MQMNVDSFNKYKNIQKMNTIFTKIIKGEIPSYKIAETNTHIAFLDIHPIVAGHTLVVPKKEIDYLFDLPDSLLADTMLFAKKVARAIDQSLKPIRTGIIVEGLEVPHAHIHLIPIYKEDQNVSLRNNVNITKEKMAEIAATIAKEVKL
jgi:histidine triad (HIT) family protein